MGMADITGLLTVMKRYEREHQMYDVVIDAASVMSIASAKTVAIPAQAGIYRAIIFINLLVGFLYFLRVHPAPRPQPAE